MVKPGGTGSFSTDVISARLAPLPPRRSLSSMGGWACVWSKSKTNGIGPPCPVRAHRGVASAVHPEWLPSQPGTGIRILLSFRRSSGAPCGRACRLLIPIPRPGVTRDRSGDVALEDLLGLAHEVAHNGELVRLEVLGHLTHLLGDRLLQARQSLLGGRDDLDPDPAAVLGVPAPGHHA